LKHFSFFGPLLGSVMEGRRRIDLEKDYAQPFWQGEGLQGLKP
jgi:hypothetical protein